MKEWATGFLLYYLGLKQNSQFIENYYTVGLGKMLDSYFFDFMSFSTDTNTVLIEQNAAVQFGVILTQNLR